MSGFFVVSLKILLFCFIAVFNRLFFLIGKLKTLKVLILLNFFFLLQEALGRRSETSANIKSLFC